MNKNFLNTVTALITVVLALHYFGSYCWFLILFNGCEINTNVLSIEDILFTWGELHLTLSTFLIWLPLLLYSLIEISEKIPIFKDMLAEMRTKAEKISTFINIKTWKGLIMFVIILMAILSFCIIPKSFATTFATIFLTLFFLLMLLPHKKRSILIPLCVVFSIVTLCSIYSNLSRSSSKSEFRDYVKIEFNNGDVIETNSCRHFIFMGSKYVIFRDTCSKTTELYPTNEIKNYKIKENSILRIKT